MCFCRTSNPDLVICSLKARIKELVSSNFFVVSKPLPPLPPSQKLVGNYRDKIPLKLLTTVTFPLYLTREIRKLTRWSVWFVWYVEFPNLWSFVHYNHWNKRRLFSQRRVFIAKRSFYDKTRIHLWFPKFSDWLTIRVDRQINQSNPSVETPTSLAQTWLFFWILIGWGSGAISVIQSQCVMAIKAKAMMQLRSTVFWKGWSYFSISGTIHKSLGFNFLLARSLWGMLA